jgi:hypothetical protein
MEAEEQHWQYAIIMLSQDYDGSTASMKWKQHTTLSMGVEKHQTDIFNRAEVFCRAALWQRICDYGLLKHLTFTFHEFTEQVSKYSETRIWFTSGIHYTYQAGSSLSIKVWQCSISTMTWHDSYPTRQRMNKWLSTLVLTPFKKHSYSTAINESNQLQLNVIPYYQEHWSFTVISSHFETRSDLSKAIDTILLRNNGTHSRGHTRAVWEFCV